MKSKILLIIAIAVILGIILFFALRGNISNDKADTTAAATQSALPTPTAVPTPSPTAKPTATPLPTPTATPTIELKIDEHAGDLVTPTPRPTLPGVAIPGWKHMTMPAGQTEITTSIPNPAANEGWYYLTFEMSMADTGEVLFTTGLIPPGQYCNGVTLTRPLEKGTYDVIVHVQPYTIDGLVPTNNANLQVTLTVE